MYLKVELSGQSRPASRCDLAQEMFLVEKNKNRLEKTVISVAVFLFCEVEMLFE